MADGGGKERGVKGEPQVLQDGTHHVGVYQVRKDATPASAGATQDVIAEAAFQ
jgi:hypothetical protein